MEANSSPSSFFKIILAQSHQKGSLQFPKSFVERHGNCFPKYACLEVPTGATWKVELRNSEGRVWLQNGWREFAEFYSIEVGYFLVFKHEGGCFFHVLIFNATGLEIKYPAGSAFTTPKVTKIKENDVDFSSDYDHARARKSHKTSRCRVPLVNQSVTGKRQAWIEKSGRKQIVSLSASMKHQLNRTHHRYKRRLLESTGIFNSDKPHFILYMTPTFVSLRGVVHIPADHFRRYLQKDYNNHGKNSMVFHGSKGRSWRVQYAVSNWNPNMAMFSSGWKPFMAENELQAGEVCMFEMINRNTKEYKVTTYDLTR